MMALDLRTLVHPCRETAESPEPARRNSVKRQCEKSSVFRPTFEAERRDVFWYAPGEPKEQLCAGPEWRRDRARPLRAVTSLSTLTVTDVGVHFQGTTVRLWSFR